MSKFEVGQTVVLTTHEGRNEARVQIERVGRKWVYVRVYGQEVAFDRETGREKRALSAPGMPSFIYTEDDWATIQRDEAVYNRLAYLTNDFNWRSRSKLTTDQMERIISILEEGEGE